MKNQTKISTLEKLKKERDSIVHRLEENHLSIIKGNFTLTSYDVLALENRLEYLNVVIERLEKTKTNRERHWIISNK